MPAVPSIRSMEPTRVSTVCLLRRRFNNARHSLRTPAPAPFRAKSGYAPAVDLRASKGKPVTIARAVATAVLCAASLPSLANDDVLFDQRNPSNTVMPGINYEGWNYNLLDQINVDTVADLQVAWAQQLGTGGEYAVAPLVVDGIMYIVHPANAPSEQMRGAVTAHDLFDHGELIWRFMPVIDPLFEDDVRRDASRPGLHYAAGTLFYQAIDGSIFALDAYSGEALWHNVNIDRMVEYTTGNGIIADDLYIVGAGSGRGRVSAFDIHTGEIRWSVYSMGPDNEVGIGPHSYRAPYPFLDPPTTAGWYADFWRRGGGEASGPFTYDIDRGMVFHGTGQCSPGDPADRRDRDPATGTTIVNLDENGHLIGYPNNFCSSVMARDVYAGGALVWAYNVAPGDPWGVDQSAVHPLVVHFGAGLHTDAIASAAGNGWFYVFDRFTGEILNQPFMYTFSDITTHVDTASGLPRYTYENWPFSTLEDRSKYVSVQPVPEGYTGTEVEFCRGAPGARSAAYSPITGYLYSFNNTGCLFGRIDRVSLFLGGTVELFLPVAEARSRWFDGRVEPGGTEYDYEDLRNAAGIAPSSQLTANDPTGNGQPWRIHFAARNSATPLVTGGGLLFIGDNHTGAFLAYDAATGDELWRVRFGGIFASSAVSYIGATGQQNVAVLVSANPDGEDRYRAHNSTLYVFALP